MFSFSNEIKEENKKNSKPKLRGTHTGILEEYIYREVYIRNAAERDGAEYILANKGDCADLDCIECPFSTHTCEVRDHKTRLELCKVMLGK